MTRTTYSIPVRTTPPFEFSVANDIEVDIESTTERKFYDGVRRKEDGAKKDAEKDSDSLYNMMFYNDDDSDNTKSKKEDQELSDNYYEKKGVHEEALEKDSADAKEMDMEYPDNRNGSLIKELRIYQEQIGSDNITFKMPAKGVIGIPGIEEVTSKGMKDTLRDKRRPICSLLKVRQLNFNSPRTLAEV